MRFSALLLLALVALALAQVSAQSVAPTRAPTDAPTASPTVQGTSAPTSRPTVTDHPTWAPTAEPTVAPTASPSAVPTYAPTAAPTVYWGTSAAPSARPTTTARPTFEPTSFKPSAAPTAAPTVVASEAPSAFAGSDAPTEMPTISRRPTKLPTVVPTLVPTAAPTPDTRPSSQPTGQPSVNPSRPPTPYPSYTLAPVNLDPTSTPTSRPSPGPTETHYPSKIPSGQPTGEPSGQPSGQPSINPTGQPTSAPSRETPTAPTAIPTVAPTDAPTAAPTIAPTQGPTMDPTSAWPTVVTAAPTLIPTASPTAFPTFIPTAVMTDPTMQPSSQPTGQPSTRPTMWEERDAFGPGAAHSQAPTALWTRDNVTGTVYFDPLDVGPCEDVEVRMTLKNMLALNRYGAYRIMTPGLTTSDCTLPPVEGAASTKPGQKLSASWPFTVTFFEGNFRDSFVGSYLVAENYEEQLAGDVWNFDLILDRENGLKQTCPGNATWDVFRFIRTPLYHDPAAFPTAAPTMADTDWYFPTVPPGTDLKSVPTSMPTGVINANEHEYGNGYVGWLIRKDIRDRFRCFFYDAQLSFFPARIQADTTVNISLTMGFQLDASDEIEVTLPGFTNKKEGLPNNPGGVYTVVDQLTVGADATLSGLTTLSTYQVGGIAETDAWTGDWYEGTPALDYADSYLKLVAQRSFPAGTPFSIIVDRCPNHLMSVYGRQPNYSGFNIKVTGSVYFTNLQVPTEMDGLGSTFDSTRFSVQAIGDNCADLNYCSGNGNCNFRNSTCECFDGYGSPRDFLHAVADNYAADCSAKSCPTGPALFKLEKDPKIGMHREIECSNNGQCNRDNGHCKCFPGFLGDACERSECPRPGGDPSQPICSDRGVCKKMSRLVRDLRALPLSSSISTQYETFHMNQTKSWDADLFHACVCDSRWDVGLTANTTQLAEFFGPSCEFRRCPSGDNPDTVADEEDCEGASQTSGTDTGAVGNKCHIECSQQGTCDHSSGVCTCYQGYYGANCGSRRVDMSSQSVFRQPINEL